MSLATLEDLETKNKFLEEELQTLRDLFQNLNKERDLESPDQRRAFMLKAQNYQLERQCMLLSQALSNRSAVLTEIESQLKQIITYFQLVVADIKPGPDVIVKRSKLMSHLSVLHKLKNSLHKQSKLESSDSLRIPSLMSGSKFLKSHKPLNCMDLYKMRPENMNTRYISRLEQELSSLRKELFSFNQLLKSHKFSDECGIVDIGKHFYRPWVKKVNTESERCISALEHCSDQLLALSLLQPSAPWNKLKMADDFGSLRYEEIVNTFSPAMQKNSSLRSTLSQMCRSHEHVTRYQNERIDLLKKQLQYQQSIQQVQSEYLLEFSTKVWEDYGSWKQETVEGICNPVAGLLQSWRLLKENQCDATLKQFLSDFKTYESDLEKLSTTPDSGNDMLRRLNKRLDESLKQVSARYDEAMKDAELSTEA